MKTWKSQYFYGNEVSDEGKRLGWVDYRTFAKAFDCVLANYAHELIAEHEEPEYINFESLEYDDDCVSEVFQWYIVDENGAEICEEFEEYLEYYPKYDLYFWGVTHYGTAWDYVMTNIKLETE